MQISIPYGFDPSTDNLEYTFVDSPTATPDAGSAVPTGATTYTYFSGINMTGNSHKYIDIYETDGSGKVIAFSELPIGSSDITPVIN